MITAKEWGSEFGDDYTERQMPMHDRRYFWQALVEEYGIESVLKVGCNTGENLKYLRIPCAGVDVNDKALAQVPNNIPTYQAQATTLPFADDAFDLAITFGVLIHIPPEDLEQAMNEIVRVARRYVFCGEYFAPGPVTPFSVASDEVPYRGGVLWRRSYGTLYEKLGLEVVDQGQFKGAPWDRGTVDWWLFNV